MKNLLGGRILRQLSSTWLDSRVLYSFYFYLLRHLCSVKFRGSTTWKDPFFHTTYSNYLRAVNITTIEITRQKLGQRGKIRQVPTKKLLETVSKDVALYTKKKTETMSAHLIKPLKPYNDDSRNKKKTNKPLPRVQALYTV